MIGIINKRVSAQDPNHFTYGIGFALNLPNTWHGRFEMMGGGGTDGSLNADPQGAAGTELGQGWAVAANDGGHEDSANNVVGGHQDDDVNAGGSAHFAIDAQARRDYGYNGIEKTATISKQIISYFYGLDTVYSYIMGCSNGGRDAMMASQRFPGCSTASSRKIPASTCRRRALRRPGTSRCSARSQPARTSTGSRSFPTRFLCRIFRWPQPRS